MRKLAFLLCSLATTLCAQDAGVLLGTVVDPSEAPVPGAQVRLTDPSRNVSREMTTTLTGDYVFDSLTPGTYSVEVVKEGFNTLRLERVVVRVRDRQNLMLRLTLSGITNSVTVQDTVEGVATDNSTGSAVDQEFIRHLPVNGRGIDSLIKMAPGVVSGAGPGGGFNVNGLRSNTNYYTLDGLSLNGVSGPMGGGMGGGGGEGSLGTEAVSLDSLSQVRVQTSTFAPEFGRTPGAQVSMMSRGGTNQFHGSLYAYWRDDKFNANDWFANASGYPRGDMYQKQFGGTVGGPVLKNRTYFFLSAESLRLLDPETALASVPSLATRASAPLALQPYLNAFPIPNGPALDDGAAQFSAVFSNPMERKSYSARIDHTINSKHTAFVRATLSPSNSTNRNGQFISPNVVTNSDNDSKGLTGALTSSLNPNTTNDLRINYTSAESSSNSFMDSFGGAVPLTDARVFPAGITSRTGEFSLQVMGISGYSFGSGSRNRQWQTNVVDSLTMVAGNHTYKAGVDYRIIAPTYYQSPYSISSNFYGLVATDEGSLLSGESLNSIVTSRMDAVYPSFHNISAYLQDTVQAGPRTSFNFGVRWDINPAPGVRSGPKPFALSSAFDGRLAQNESLYDTRWADIAPRFGFSHMIKAKPGKEFLVRFGFGAFHDLGYGSTAAAFSGAPYANIKTLSLETFPLSAANKEAPGLPPTKPYGQVSAAVRDLQSPLVYQWNLTLEQNLGRGQIVSAGYVGTRGRRLLITASSASFSDDYDIIRAASNGAESDYHGLQLQYQRRLSRRLQA